MFCWSSGVEYESYTIVGVAFGLPGSLSWWKSFKVRLFSGCRSCGLFGFANVGIGVFVVIVLVVSAGCDVVVFCCGAVCCGGVFVAICGAAVGLGCGALAVWDDITCCCKFALANIGDDVGRVGAFVGLASPLLCICRVVSCVGDVVACCGLRRGVRALSGGF